MFDVDTVDVFRRPEGKFKKKQNPRDEALQILKPQMDNPPAPQVHTHTQTHKCAFKMLEYTVTEREQCLQRYGHAQLDNS